MQSPNKTQKGLFAGDSPMKLRPFPVSFDSPIKHDDVNKDLFGSGYFNTKPTTDASMLSPYSVA